MRIESLVTHVQQGGQHPATIENIGLGGARLLMEGPISQGDSVTLSFRTPSSQRPFVLHARVAWVSPVRRRLAVGVAFEHEAASAAFGLYEVLAILGKG